MDMPDGMIVATRARDLGKSPGATVVLGVVAALAVLLLTTPAWAAAAVNCAQASTTADSDNDGFTDAQECAGIVLAPGNTLLRSDGTTIPAGGTIPRCGAAALVPGSPARQDCVDPDTPDLFVILVQPASNSVLVALGLDPTATVAAPRNRLPMLEFVSNRKADGGLGLALHRLTTTRTDRRVMPVVAGASAQKAIKFTENLTVGNLVGFCQWGTPNSPSTGGQCTIYTAKVRTVVQTACGTGVTCNLRATDPAAPPAGVDAVITKYIKQAFAHEAAHAMLRTDRDVVEVPQHHLAAESNVITEEFEVFKVAANGVTWYISDDFSSSDQANFRLK
jgi:hypothetical protein